MGVSDADRESALDCEPEDRDSVPERADDLEASEASLIEPDGSSDLSDSLLRMTFDDSDLLPSEPLPLPLLLLSASLLLCSMEVSD